MPTERMEEVEVVCGRCAGKGTLTAWANEVHPGSTPTSGGVSSVSRVVICPSCVGGANKLPVKPGSLTAARLRLADAAEAWAAKWLAPAACRDQDEWDAMLESAVKLAALRTARGA